MEFALHTLGKNALHLQVPLVCWNPPKGSISEIICNRLAGWPFLDFDRATLLHEKQPLLCQVILSVTQQEYEPRSLVVLWFSGASFSIWGWGGGAGGSPHTLAWSTPRPSSKMTPSTFPFFPGFQLQAPAAKSEAASGIFLLHFGREERWSNCTMTDRANPPGASNPSRRCGGDAAHLRISLRRGSLAWSLPPGGVTSEQLRVLGSLGGDQREELAAAANHRPAKPPRYSWRCEGEGGWLQQTGGAAAAAAPAPVTGAAGVRVVQEFSQPFCCAPAAAWCNPRVREGSCVLTLRWAEVWIIPAGRLFGRGQPVCRDVTVPAEFSFWGRSKRSLPGMPLRQQLSIANSL